MRQDDIFWLWLSLKIGPNNPIFLELFQEIGSPFDIYRADINDFERIKGLKGSIKAALIDKQLSDAQSILTWCRENRVVLCRYGETTYPSRLMSIKSPPLLLYVKGNMPDLSKKLCVGVVGTRNCSEYGAHATYKISYELATAGAVIVSGMAKGIDGVSAAAAVTAGGLTIAVLGCGLDVVYPKAHAGLMNEISRHGAVITEYPPFAEPNGKHFPVRNRIISGLSDSALIVEAPEHSGALITADLAGEQNRLIYAMPGSVNSNVTAGTNRLLQNGANAAVDGYDILYPFLPQFQQFLFPEKIRKIKGRSAYSSAVFKKLRMPDYALLAQQRNGLQTKSEEEESSGIVEAMAEKFANADNVEATTESRVPDVQTKKQGVGLFGGIRKSRKVTKEKPKKAAQAGNQTAVTTHESASTQSKKYTEDELAVLSEKARRIFSELPLDQIFSPDQLVKLGYSAGEIMQELMILEVKGFIHSLPGGLYQRN